MANIEAKSFVHTTADDLDDAEYHQATYLERRYYAELFGPEIARGIVSDHRGIWDNPNRDPTRHSLRRRPQVAFAKPATHEDITSGFIYTADDASARYLGLIEEAAKLYLPLPWSRHHRPLWIRAWVTGEEDAEQADALLGLATHPYTGVRASQPVTCYAYDEETFLAESLKRNLFQPGEGDPQPITLESADGALTHHTHMTRYEAPSVAMVHEHVMAHEGIAWAVERTIAQNQY